MKLKRGCFAVLIMFTCAAIKAHGASVVTLYGLIDAGVSYVSNEGGHGNVKFDDGIQVPNLLGFKGDEDLGGGVHAIFDLVNQFSVGTGAFLPGKGIFGRTALVGVSSERYGKLTLGNQYDFMTDGLFFAQTDAAMFVGGLYNLRAGPFNKIAIPYNPPYAGSFDWDRMSGETVKNSVKYQSPSLGGFRVGALYGFGGVPGSFGAGNSVSVGLNYDRGPLGLAAAYTAVKYPQSNGTNVGIRNWGMGGHYNFGKLNTMALLTTVRNTANGGVIEQIEVGATYLIVADVEFGADYMYMKGNAFLDNNHAHQFTTALDYFLSKRTTVYAEVVYQRANSGANALVSGVLDPSGTSSGSKQLIARVGMQTRF